MVNAKSGHTLTFSLIIYWPKKQWAPKLMVLSIEKVSSVLNFAQIKK